jgi:hypothetical protein
VSRKGRRKNSENKGSGNSLSRSPGDKLMHRYVSAVHSGRDLAPIIAVASWKSEVLPAEKLKAAEGKRPAVVSW